MKTLLNLSSIVLTVVITTVLAVVFFASRQNAHAVAANLPQAPGGYHVNAAPQSIPVDVKRIETHPADVQIELCMEMPTLDPWTPYASLLVDGTIIPNSGVVLLNAKDLHLMENAYRCYQFTFPFSTEGSLSGKATLRLENLWLELGRGQFDAKTIAEVKNRVQQAAPGLEFEIVSESGKGGGGGYFNIISLPQNMNEADALKIIQQMTLDEYLINWQSEISFK